jgi:hypothetical protein
MTEPLAWDEVAARLARVLGEPVSGGLPLTPGWSSRMTWAAHGERTGSLVVKARRGERAYAKTAWCAAACRCSERAATWFRRSSGTARPRSVACDRPEPAPRLSPDHVGRAAAGGGAAAGRREVVTVPRHGGNTPHGSRRHHRAAHSARKGKGHDARLKAAKQPIGAAWPASTDELAQVPGNDAEELLPVTTVEKAIKTTITQAAGPVTHEDMGTAYKAAIPGATVMPNTRL